MSQPASTANLLRRPVSTCDESRPHRLRSLLPGLDCDVLHPTAGTATKAGVAAPRPRWCQHHHADRGASTPVPATAGGQECSDDQPIRPACVGLAGRGAAPAAAVARRAAGRRPWAGRRPARADRSTRCCSCSSVVSLVLIPVAGLGFAAFPVITAVVRWRADLARRLAAWSGVPIASPYRPMPPDTPFGTWRRFRHVVSDPATWLDFAWLLPGRDRRRGLRPAGRRRARCTGWRASCSCRWCCTSRSTGGATACSGRWTTSFEALLSIPQGVVFLVVGLAGARWLTWIEATFASYFLRPTESAALAQRVRTADRHPGRRGRRPGGRAAPDRARPARRRAGPARLAQHEHRSGRGAAAATTRTRRRELLAEARAVQRAGAARPARPGAGHPPAGAGRARAGRGGTGAGAGPAVPGRRSTSTCRGRPPGPVESAAYFAVAEALANVAKHSGATTAWVRLAPPGRPARRPGRRQRQRRRRPGRRHRSAGDRAPARRLRWDHGGVQPAGRTDRRDHGAAVRVVIAEDLALLRDGLTRLLTAFDCEVVAAVDNGPALLPALLEHRPDVAVVDVRLPPTFKDEGLQAAIAARAQVPGLPVLVLSQHVEQLYARELLADRSGGVGYLLKDRVSDVRPVRRGGTPGRRRRHGDGPGGGRRSCWPAAPPTSRWAALTAAGARGARR